MHDKYVLFTDLRPENITKGIKNIVKTYNTQIKEITKMLTLDPTNDNLKRDFNLWTLKKLIVQFLYDGPMLTIHPISQKMIEDLSEIIYYQRK